MSTILETLLATGHPDSKAAADAADRKARALAHYTGEAAKLQPSKADRLRALVLQAATLAAELDGTGEWSGMDAVSEHLDAAHDALGDCYAATLEELSEQSAEAFRELCDDDRRAGLL